MAESYPTVNEAGIHTARRTKCEPGLVGTVGYHQAGEGLAELVGHATRNAFLHLTTMYYDSEENSSGSASDCEGKFDNDNIDNDNDDDNDRDDAKSNASYGENLRVRSLPFSLGVLII